MISSASLPLMFGLIASLSALAACHPRAPFAPGTDCAKVAHCGQCASRGGCGWRGDPGDAGTGQCVDAGAAATASLIETPDRCPVPPADEPARDTATSTTTSTSAMAKAVGPNRYAAIRSALLRAFPDALITDDVVDGVAAVLLRAPTSTPADGPKDAAGREVAPIRRRVKEKAHRLYLGEATHHRVKSMPPEARPMESKFTLALPMVRVTLPERLDGDPIVTTEIGDVDLSRDHLLGSIDLVAGKYSGKDYLGYRPERVDLITPARAAGGRFAAIAIYLGYRRQADRGPSFYMFEAGTATGDAKMIYFSPDMQPIKGVTSHYLPTPFVTMRNTYSGVVTMSAAPNEDEPAYLVIRSQVPGDDAPYITVTLQYRRAPTLELPLPIELTADAGARVALIARTMGLASAIELEPVLAALAQTLHWEEVPRYVEDAAEARP